MDQVSPMDTAIERVLRGTHVVAGSFDRLHLAVRLNSPEDTIERLMGHSQDSLVRALRGDLHLLLAQITFEHEVSHWHQMVGTTYGYFLVDAEESKARALGTFIERHRKRYPGKQIAKPLQKWVRDRWPDRQRAYRRAASAGRTLEQYVSTSSNEMLSFALAGLTTDFLENVLEGRENTDELLATFLASLTPRMLFGNRVSAPLHKSSFPDFANDVSGERRPESAVPVTSSGHLLGAWSICESQAYVASLLKVQVLENKYNLGLVKEYRQSTLVPEYMEPLDIFLGALPSDHQGSFSLMTFLVLCDLALSSPLHPEFLRLADGLSWKDLHPGWRFLRCCDALKHVGQLNCGLSIPREEYVRYVSSICTYLRWPSPIDMAHHFLSVDLNNRLPAIIPNLFRAACALRIEEPSMFALLSFEDSERYARMLEAIPMPPILVKGGVRLGGGVNMSELERQLFTMSLLRQGNLFDLANQVLFENGEFHMEDGMDELWSIGDALKGAWHVNVEDFEKTDIR